MTATEPLPGVSCETQITHLTQPKKIVTVDISRVVSKYFFFLLFMVHFLNQLFFRYDANARPNGIEIAYGIGTPDDILVEGFGFAVDIKLKALIKGLKAGYEVCLESSLSY